MISGFATREGTKKFKESIQNQNNFKEFQNLHLSNVGVGTYLGDVDGATDQLVIDAIKNSVNSGINVIDTAINYRSQKAERSVGKAVSELIEENKIKRNQIFINTKNGYVTNDAEVKQDFWPYVNSEYVQKGIIQSGDISSDYHCMTVPYLEDQLERSLKNLDMDCVDLMYIHNPVEGQFKDKSREEFLLDLKDVFEMYESKRNDGKIKFYGMATWECFRVSSDNPQFLSIPETINIAKQVGGENHGFRFIQLPYNLYYDQALLSKNQNVNGQMMSALETAKHFGIGVFTSVPFMQGRLLAPDVMPEFNELKPSLRALQFVRSSSGVISPLVGQKSPEHVLENLEIMKIDPLSDSEFSQLVQKLTS